MNFQKQISKNDCFSACLASILNVPVSNVPNFYNIVGSQHDLLLVHVNKYLERFNLKCFFILFSNEVEFNYPDSVTTPRPSYYIIKPDYKNIIDNKYYIGIYQVKFREIIPQTHAVICKNRSIVFDPSQNYEEKDFKKIFGAYFVVSK